MGAGSVNPAPSAAAVISGVIEGTAGHGGKAKRIPPLRFNADFPNCYCRIGMSGFRHTDTKPGSTPSE